MRTHRVGLKHSGISESGKMRGVLSHPSQDDAGGAADSCLRCA